MRSRSSCATSSRSSPCSRSSSSRSCCSRRSPRRSRARSSPMSRQCFSAAGNRGATEAATAALSRDSGSSTLSFLLSAAGVVARLLMWSAIISLIATAYAGSRITFGQAYRVGFQRWLPQVVVALAFLVLGAGHRGPAAHRVPARRDLDRRAGGAQPVHRGGRRRRRARLGGARSLRGGVVVGVHDVRARGGGRRHRDGEPDRGDRDRRCGAGSRAGRACARSSAGSWCSSSATPGRCR